MPRLTDYVRKGFRRRRRPWDGAELPEWWDVLVWGALALVGGMLLVGAIFDGGPSGGASRKQPTYSVQTVNPYGTPPTVAGPSPSSTPGLVAGDFAAAAPLQVAMTGGGTAVVPAGAHAVAVAAAQAEATGFWSGIPLAGATRPRTAHRSTHGRVIGDITVEDPATTGNDSYVFSANITHDTAARTYLVKITVQRTRDGYAVLGH